MKRPWIFWVSVIAGAAVLIFVLLATRVLPLPPAPPYKNGENQWITPENPWTW